MKPFGVETPTVLSTYRNPAGADGRPSAPSCITGMHRSGTSMVARLLQACGVFLGPEDELSQPARDNLGGYFENLHFVKLNEDLLAQFGGGWDDPPILPTGWEFAPEVSSFLERAEKLVGQFRRHNWAWKDPRNSLTLPFWQRLIPDLKIVVCVRNPVEVARSLFVRGDAISPSEFQLWQNYYRQLLSATQPADRLVTHYQSYFQNPRAELLRVLDWLDLEVSDEAVERACAHISAELRHHYAMTAELIGAEAPDEVLGLYLSLCAEAGPIYHQARQLETAGELKHAATRANEVSVLMNELQQLRSFHNEILNSKSFRLVSLYWRLRRRR